MQGHEKTHSQSKKLIFSYVVEIGWKLVLAYMVVKGSSDLVLIVVICVAGFAETAYVLGQSGVDTFTRMTENLMRVPTTQTVVAATSTTVVAATRTESTHTVAIEDDPTDEDRPPVPPPSGPTPIVGQD